MKKSELLTGWQRAPIRLLLDDAKPLPREEHNEPIPKAQTPSTAMRRGPATKEEARMAHKVKMERKRLMRPNLQSDYTATVTPNISAHHPDAGASIILHNMKKEGRDGQSAQD